MLKGAIIGIGKIAQESHIPAYLSNNTLTEKVRIIAAVDPDERSKNEAKTKFPGLKFYNSLIDLFGNEELDFIDICSPPSSHCKLIKEGIENGVHVLCEKPLALNLLEAEQLNELLCRNNLVFYPCHQYKYSVIWEQFKKFTEEIGSDESYFAQFNIFRTHADPGLKILDNNWRINQNLSGGGIMSDTGFHYLYLALWFAGIPNYVTSKIFRLVHKDYDVEDTAAILLENSKGIIQINLTWGANQRLNNASLITSKKNLLYFDNKITLNSSDVKSENLVPDAADKANYILMYEKLITDFIQTIEQGKINKSGIEESYQTMKLLHTCYKSAQLNQTIAFS